MFEALINDPTIFEVTIVLILLMSIAIWQKIKQFAAILGGIYLFYLLFIIFSYEPTGKIIIKEDTQEDLVEASNDNDIKDIIVDRDIVSEKVNVVEFSLLVINLFGLYRSHNRAAFTLLTVILLFFIFKDSIFKRKYIFVALVIILCFVYFLFIFDYGYNSASQLILVESFRSSNIDIERDVENRTEKFVVDQDYKTLINTGNNKDALTNTQLKLIESFTSDRKIPFVPHVISLLSIFSLIINRSEKLGIFFSKYNPDLYNFLFGYGPQQLSEYHNGHQIKSSLNGLIIPHSSFLLFLIFFGFTGVLFLGYLLIKNINKANNHLNYSNYLLTFILINYLKSDSMLYLSGFVLLFLVISLNKDSFIYE